MSDSLHSAQYLRQIMDNIQDDLDRGVRCGTMLALAGKIRLWDGHPSEEAMHRANGTMPGECAVIRGHHSYSIKPQSADLGDGWQLILQHQSEDQGGGVFRPSRPRIDMLDAWIAARDQGEAWIACDTFGTPRFL